MQFMYIGVFTCHLPACTNRCRFAVTHEIVPGTSGNQKARYMMRPSGGEMRDDQPMDFKPLLAWKPSYHPTARHDECQDTVCGKRGVN